MIFTLIIFCSILSLLHYVGMESFLYLCIGLPLHVYLGLLFLLISIKVISTLYKFYPALRRVINSIHQVTNKVDTLANKLEKFNSGPFDRKGQTRKFSSFGYRSFPQTEERGESPVRRSKDGTVIEAVTMLQLRQRQEAKTGKRWKLSPSIPENNRFSVNDRLSAVRIRNSDVNAMTVVKGGAWWVNIFIRMLQPIGLTVTGPRVHAIVIIFRKISKIGSTQGIKGLVIFLKACSVCLIQALAGHRIHGKSLTKGLGCRISRTNRGIPRFILSNDRVRIQKGFDKLVKLYESVFQIYRVLDFYGKVKLNTIVGPFTGNYQESIAIYHYIPSFCDVLQERLRKRFSIKPQLWGFGFKQSQIWPNVAMEWLKEAYSELKADWIVKSAPGTKHDTALQVSTHPILMIRSAEKIANSPIYGSFRVFTDLLPINHKFMVAWRACLGVKGLFKPLWSLGKLALKEEPAGKVRVFAMVTAWYQIILKPLHLLIFEILKVLHRNDGTFDQLAPLKHFLDKKEAYSLDLSAATDRLPISLQVALLGRLLDNIPLANAWANMLVGIEYSINSFKYGLNDLISYSVGQPMGALSSWGMLALTHHFVVQASAWHCGVVPVGTWFKDYVVLGDDIVIFNREVKDQYLKFMKALGMEFGLHKSVLSRNGTALEFAKRMFWKGNDVSAVPVLEFTAALMGLGAFKEFGRKYKLSKLQMAKCLGFRYKALAKLNSGNFAALNYKLKVLSVALCIPDNEADAKELMSLGAPRVPNVRNPIPEIIAMFSDFELKRMCAQVSRMGDKLRGDITPFWNLGNVKERLALDPITSKKGDQIWTNS